jgi:hypothetical protein
METKVRQGGCLTVADPNNGIGQDCNLNAVAVAHAE